MKPNRRLNRTPKQAHKRRAGAASNQPGGRPVPEAILPIPELIFVKDLPPGLTSEVFETIGFFTIAFLRINETDGLPSLLGSGVLVSFGNTRAILTADHVVKALPILGRVTLFLDRTSQPHSVDVTGLVPVTIGKGSDKRIGPDLAVIILAPHIAGALAAKKSFYNLEMRRDQLLNNPPDIRDGAWFAQGFLEERTSIRPDPFESGFTKYFYNFTGVGSPEKVEQIDAFDYFDFPVSYDARPTAPVSWGGMSGGGLWQVQLKRVEGQLTSLPPLLSGVLFYQHETTTTECGVRAHGRRSIYDEAYRIIRNDQ
jgi:hypothetical protein